MWISKRIKERRLDRQLNATVDAWIADAEERAMYRDVSQGLAQVSLLIADAEAAARRGNHDAGRRLQVLVAPLERLADALGGSRGA